LTDDRLWRPDLLAVLDWGDVFQAGQKSYSETPLATWWIQATAGVNYYRAEVPAKHLPGKTVFFETRDIQAIDDEHHHLPRQEGAAIWLFPGNLTRWLVMAEMHESHGIRVLVEVDDNYMVGPPVIPALRSGWLTTRDTEGQDRHSYEVHRKIVASKACDGVIVSTPYLGKVYERFDKPVYVCPNSIDPDDWPADPEHAPDGVLRIGWAGSASHRYDLADIRPALDWASRQPDVEVVIMGQIDPGVPHRNIPWTDTLAEYRQNVPQIDVMLCPLRPGVWADCKSDVKALEAAMGGAVAVVSKTEPYRPWWDSDAPCLVAETRKDFVKAVKHLVQHRDETATLATAARKWALDNRSIEGSVAKWREAIAP